MWKRAMDICLAGSALALLSPLLGVVAIAVLLDSGRPILFSQIRVGRHFRAFRLWKFRTMIPHAGGPLITAAGDARITRVGRWLRKSKLDELPQLWNVLRGDMSLVGPRPEVPLYVEMFHDRYAEILRVRPGITDAASLQFLDEEKILAAADDPSLLYASEVLPMKLTLAEDYVRNRSLATDVAVLVRTAAAVFRLHDSHAPDSNAPKEAAEKV